MLRAMYSGISGMKVNQVKLDVIGNNVANVGTTSFKGSRVRFQDMLSQNTGMAVSPSRTLGGLNPQQVGLGAQLAGIDTIVTQGNMQPTGRNLDVAFDGSGYLIVGRGTLPKSNELGIGVGLKEHAITTSKDYSISFTRDGALTLDNQGNLLTSDGYRIMGYAIKEGDGTNKEARSVNYSKGGACEYVNANTEYGLISEDTLVPLRIPNSVTINPMSIPVDAEGNGLQMNYTGSGSTSNEGFKHATINTAGKKYTGDTDLKIQYKYEQDSEDNQYYWTTYVNGLKVDRTTGLTSDEKLNALLTEGFGADDTSAGMAITITEPDGFQDSIRDDDDEKKNFSWEFTIQAPGQKKIRDFSIEKNGLLKAVLEDGKVSVLGQLAMATFKNPAGLSKAGKNMLQNSPNSGDAIIRSGIGVDKKFDNSDGYGDMLNGTLEMSNIDLAEQFTDMIVTTRAFQASSKIISTGDEILQELINLKR